MKIALALALALTATAAQAQEADYAWTTASNGGVHYLIYGAAEADNPRLELTCFASRPGTADLRVFDADAPGRPTPRRVTLRSGSARFTARGRMALADPTPSVFMAEVPLSGPVMANFRRAGALIVSAGVARTTIPASPPQQRAAVAQFFTRCEAR